jgi:hypothetical protein
LNVATLTVEGEYCSLQLKEKRPRSPMSGSADRPRCRSRSRRAGHDIAAAESLVAIFEGIQRMHQLERQAIIQELERVGPAQT